MAQIAINKCKTLETIPQRVLEEVQGVTEAIRQRAFDLFQGRGGGAGSDINDWLLAEKELTLSPASELVDDEKEFRARLALPGFDPKDIEVTALPDALVVQAGTTHTHDEEKGNVRFCEFSEKKLFRRLELPATVDVDKVTASVDKGILEVTAPKVTVKQIAVAA